MLGGIGTKGGKKDLKQTKKNQEEKKKKNLKLKDEKEKTKSIENNKKKKQEQEILQNNLQQAKQEREQEKKDEEKIEQQIKKTQENNKKKETEKKEPKEVIFLEQDRKKKKFAIEKTETVQEKKEESQQENTLESNDNQVNNEKDNTKVTEDINKKKQQEEKTENQEIESEKTPRYLGVASIEQKETEEQSLEQIRQQQESILELKVAEELERLLNDNRYELKKLYTELDIIQKETDYIYESEDAEIAIEEIEHLIEQLNQIKKQLEAISKSYDLDGIFDLDDKYFSELVERYKEQVKDQRTIEDKVADFKRDEEYISLINKIIDFEKQQEELSQTLEEKRLELEERDKKFEEIETQYLTVKQIQTNVQELVITSRRYLLEIEEKLKHAVSTTVKTEIVVKSSLSTLNKTLLFLALFHKNPLMRANIASAIGTVATLNLLKDFLNPKTEERKYLHYQVTDYTSLITEALNNTYIATTLIQTGKKQIQDIKEIFEKDFKQYRDILPEYKELLTSLDTIEQELTEKEFNITKIQETMKLEQNINNNKILEYSNRTENL